MKINPSSLAILGLPAALTAAAYNPPENATPTRPESTNLLPRPSPLAPSPSTVRQQLQETQSKGQRKGQESTIEETRHLEIRDTPTAAANTTSSSSGDGVSSTSGTPSSWSLTYHNTWTNLESSSGPSDSSTMFSSTPTYFSPDVPSVTLTALAVFTINGEPYTATSIPGQGEVVDGKTLTSGEPVLIGGEYVSQGTKGIVVDGATVTFTTASVAPSESLESVSSFNMPSGTSQNAFGGSSSSSATGAAATGNGAAPVGAPTVGGMELVGLVGAALGMVAL